MENNTKYIFVTGGVASSLGKGILSASLAKLLQARGYSITIQKLDPYLNIDPGTLNPYEHGECYVTNDGAETDLDLGHYERFLNIPTSKANNVTTGEIYQYVIEKERKGDYLGKTVQIIPHITNEIKRRIKILGSINKYDIIITEIGGTVGDIESLPYIEAVRQLKQEMGNSSIVIHLTLVPFLSATGELKTKPTQHSVKTLLENGIQPDILVLRTEHFISQDIKEKVALFCNVEITAVIQSLDVSTIYEVPIEMLKERLDETVLKKLSLQRKEKPKLKLWRNFLNHFKNPTQEVNIALIGKYVELHDAYKSIAESFIHAGAFLKCHVNIQWIHSEDILKLNTEKLINNISGILVAPGFGERGIEGKLQAVKLARENNIPFLGICLGMQVAVIEFAKNVIKIEDANSVEINPTTPNPVIDIMEEQKRITNKGGTMRLGTYDCKLTKNSNAYKAYNQYIIKERHRHRYEFNNKFQKVFQKAGMLFTGTNPNSGLVEIIELPAHKWFVGVQFHPEYQSTVITPHPLFVSFVKVAMQN